MFLVIVQSLIVYFSWTLVFVSERVVATRELDESTAAITKKLRRYGFHKTKECHDFEKAFLCVQKCIDLGYHVAHSDEKCICTCYRSPVKAKYMANKSGSTKWRLGAPTTKLPWWAQTAKQSEEEKKLNDTDKLHYNVYKTTSVPSVDSTVEPETSVNATREAESAVDTTIEPVSSVNATIEPESSVNATIEPVSSVNATIEPESSVNATIEPESKSQVTIEPESKSDATIEPESKAQASSNTTEKTDTAAE
ncbi:hypothetical protein evm_012784 [Chilo suppressalis]|nr:hypothetical protein evm_012784 [Chilo suppressalis]